jgi:hypothetical protein
MRLPNLTSGPLTDRPLRSMGGVLSPSELPMTRRGFLASSLTTSSVALAPSHTLAFSSWPAFLTDMTRFRVSCSGHDWTVDCTAYDGRPFLDLVKFGSGYRGSLRRASFASIEVSAELQFEISQSASGEWMSRLSAHGKV